MKDKLSNHYVVSTVSGRIGLGVFDYMSVKYQFTNDYSELAHPKVLEALMDVGNRQFEGYGLDEYCSVAAGLIREKLGDPTAGVHFISGGTHANLTVISSILRPYEAVIACDTGHINTHETGAVEAAGHKICTVRNRNGKLDTNDINSVVEYHSDEHMVKPRLVYISQSTESGTVYKKAELQSISEYCREHDLILYIDGARFGAAVNSGACDFSYNDIAGLADAFYIGGTKNGALFGEAVVVCKDELKSDFRFHLKQRGALLAKGASIGVQFQALFTGGLYDELAKHANELASRLADGIKAQGYELLYGTETNQVFPVFADDTAERMRALYSFYDWEKVGAMTAMRLVVSWAASESVIDEFLADLGKY